MPRYIDIANEVIKRHPNSSGAEIRAKILKRLGVSAAEATPKMIEAANEPVRREKLAAMAEKRRDSRLFAGKRGEDYRRIIVEKIVGEREYRFHATKGPRSYTSKRSKWLS